MAYLNKEELENMGFKSLGKNVLISDKASIYNTDKIEIGDNSRIDDFCLLSGKIQMGRNVHIAAFCNIAGGEKGIVCGDFSGIAYGSHVFTQSDDYGGEALVSPTIPAKYKKETKKAIVIGKHAIVGTSSLIFPGVVLAEGTAVGAHSMITKSTLEWSIYFGSPAKRIKARKRGMLILEKEYLENEAKDNS